MRPELITVIWMSKWASKNGTPATDWGYRFDRLTLAAGLLGGILMLGAVFLTAPVDVWLFGSSSAAGGPGVPVEPAWSIALLLLVNGILVPACEERVWRGMIHTNFARVLGMATGTIVTALAFSLKHVIIDGSLGRLFTLVVFGIFVSVIRSRWGTTASTVAHCTTNLAATIMLLMA